MACILEGDFLHQKLNCLNWNCLNSCGLLQEKLKMLCQDKNSTMLADLLLPRCKYNECSMFPVEFRDSCETPSCSHLLWCMWHSAAHNVFLFLLRSGSYLKCLILSFHNQHVQSLIVTVHVFTGRSVGVHPSDPVMPLQVSLSNEYLTNLGD